MGRQPCCDKVGVKKGPWTAEEDQKLVSFLLTHGHCCWRVVPKLAGLLRCGKSCRLRWTNYLRPDLKRGLLSGDEEKLVIELHAQLGNRWSKIAARLPGRTDNEIKNHWNTHIRKKLLRMGVDPVTHLPLQRQQQEASPAPPPPPLHEQLKPQQQQQLQEEQKPEPPPHQQEQQLPPIQPQETPAPPASSVSSASSAAVVSPPCSSSASGGGVEATEWPEPSMYLFGMDGIMDAGWGGGLFPGDGGLGLDDPFDQYPVVGDDWL